MNLLRKLLKKVNPFSLEPVKTDWTEHDAITLRAYLQTDSGKKMLDLFGAGVSDRAVFRREEEATPWNNGFTAGQADILNRLLALAETHKPQEENSDER